MGSEKSFFEIVFGNYEGLNETQLTMALVQVTTLLAHEKICAMTVEEMNGKSRDELMNQLADIFSKSARNHAIKNYEKFLEANKE
ncbi:hypothetical protein V3H38_23015 [Vibrio parahaemolyticus]|uniref:hypothetical protein n=1 Tax=Vibrio parahaemolyticus TaxID=670 RepID=UPI00236315BD|nr:hypothetical protein [Vibrio parahaemolyticus]